MRPSAVTWMVPFQRNLTRRPIWMAKFKADFTAGLLPTDPLTFEGHAASSRYFKFWALATAATMKPADVRRSSDR